ncbi:hypothetical protein C8R44DRAFT_869858 [Mycena epipterygia]|nr:hypothetical protein C8R44DRAFT_869858 [Mycena epipterygia]
MSVPLSHLEVNLLNPLALILPMVTSSSVVTYGVPKVFASGVFSFLLPLELWFSIVRIIIFNCLLSAKESAAFRAILACVSKGWHTCIYSSPKFWSVITIFKHLPMYCLDFVLAHCVCMLEYHCEKLLVNSLTSFLVAYVYMPGYSPHVANKSIYELPFDPQWTWFRWDLPRLQVVVEITDFSMSMKPEALHVLFNVAVRMQVLRFGALQSYSCPPSFSLHSTSLRMLDIEYYHGIFIGELLTFMVVPNLVDLTVREVHEYIYLLLDCPLLESVVGLCHSRTLILI